MLIILEGPDGAGKTTLAERLSNEIHGIVDVRHCGQPERGPIDEYIYPLMQYLPGYDDHIIYDRHYLGELVYGPLYREQSNIDIAMKWTIEEFLNQRGALLVHVTHEVDVLKQRCKDKNEDFLNESDVFFCHQQFIEEVAESGIRFKMTVKDAGIEDIRDIVWLAHQLELRYM